MIAWIKAIWASFALAWARCPTGSRERKNKSLLTRGRYSPACQIRLAALNTKRETFEVHQ